MSEDPSPPRTPERRQRVQSAEMGMGILKALARLGGTASLTAVATAVDESTAKVHRYLASLIQEDLVVQDSSTQHYRLGPEAIQIGLAAMRQNDPVRRSEPALIRLRDELGVTCFLAIMGNLGPTIMRFEEPLLPVTINVRAGSVLPALWSATGQVFLSTLDDAAQWRRLQDELAQASHQQRARLGVQTLEQLRDQVRAKGCAIARDSLLPGISAVAAPITDYSGRVVAVLTALGATGGFDPGLAGPIAPLVLREAAAISASLGAVSVA